MTEKLKPQWEKIKEAFGKIPKKALITCLVALVIVAAALTVFLNTRPYAVLFTGLSNEEASAIMSYLGEQGVVDYRLENTDTILVPKAQETALKAQLLMAGYPKSGFSYSTYYDHVSALSTETERNQAYLFTLQERMGAVIRCLDGVKDAEVTINQGEDRSYVLDSGNVVEASAGVIVTMRNGQKLTNQQAAAIRSLVAHAVKGLKIESVSISDSMGNLYNGGDSAVSSDASALKLQLEQEYENKIRTEIMQALSPFFGSENVRVSVNCNVDIDRTLVNSTDVFLPDWAADGSTNGKGIIGSQIYNDAVIRDGNGTVGGVVGTETNSDLSTYVENGLTPNGDELEIGASGQIDYDNPRKDTQVERIAGYLTDCMVAVSINSTTAGPVDVDAMRAHVARASRIGNDVAEEKISILSIPFYAPPIVPIGPDRNIPTWLLLAVAGGALLLLSLIIILVIVLRRRKKKRLLLSQEAEQRQAVNEFLMNAGIPVPTEPAGADVMSLQSERSMELRKDIRKFADENPEIAAQMVKSWLKGGEDDG